MVDVREIGRKLGRERREKGWVVKVGGKAKRWLGYYHVYVANEQGLEERKRRKITLGLCSQLTKGAAEEALEKHIREARSEPAAQEKRNTVADLIKDYVALKSGDWSEAHLNNVRIILSSGVTPAIGHMPISEVTAETLKQLVNALPMRQWKSGKTIKTGASHSYVRKVVLHLRSAFDLAIVRELILRNPARHPLIKLTVPKQSAKPKSQPYLSFEQVALLMLELEGEDQLIIRIALVCALRPNEIFALRYNDVDLKHARLNVDEALDHKRRFKETKTGTEVSVCMPPALVARLEEWIRLHPGRPEDLLFPNRDGNPRDRTEELKSMLKPAAIRAGLGKVTFQMLRRTFSTLAQNTGSLKSIQGQMRHARLDMTVNQYMQTIPIEQQQAVDQLDEMLFGTADPARRVQ